MLKNKIKIGEFDVRLVIESNTPTIDDTTNERIKVWSEVSTVWAKRMTRSGKEGYEADQQVATNKEAYLIRYSSDLASVDATHRIYEEGTTDYYYVLFVEKQRREGWILLTAEIKNG